MLGAWPSGGPYGPQRVDYEVPAKAASVYYVAPDGDPEAEGSTLSKPTTLAAAIGRVRTGDAVILRGGIYRTGSMELNQGIYLQPYRDEQPVLKGTEVATEWQGLANGLWRTSWSKLFPSAPDTWWRRFRHGHETPLYWFNNDMVFIDGRLLEPAGWEGEVDANSYFINYEEEMVYIGTNPDGHLVEITAHDNALTRVITPVHGKEPDRLGPKIRGITFTQYAYRALEIEANEPVGPADPSTYGKEVVGTLLENVSITFCSRVAAYLRGDGLVIRNCLVSDTETEGLYIISSNNVLLERNIIRRNNMQKMTGYFPSAVKIFNQSHNVTCRDNLVVENPNSSGIWYDVGNVDGLFVDNWIEECTDGFFFEISKGAIAAGNVFVNCEKGVRALNSCDVQVYNNTFINSMAAFERTTRSAVNDHFGWHPATGPDVDERDGHVFVNNLLLADEQYHRILLHVHQVPELCGVLMESQMKRSDFNVYVRSGAHPAEPGYGWSPVPGDSCYVETDSLDELRELAPGFGKHSREWADYAGPVLQSILLRNLRPLSGFPGNSVAGPIDEAVLEILGWEENPASPGAFPVLE